MAITNLSYLYLNGYGIGRDPTQALDWENVAVSRGFTHATVYELKALSEGMLAANVIDKVSRTVLQLLAK